MTGTRITEAVPINAELDLHGGVTVSIKERWASDQLGKSRDTLETVLNRINERAG